MSDKSGIGYASSVANIVNNKLAEEGSSSSGTAMNEAGNIILAGVISIGVNLLKNALK